MSLVVVAAVGGDDLDVRAVDEEAVRLAGPWLDSECP